MKTENEQILLDVESENIYRFSTASTFGIGVSYPSVRSLGAAFGFGEFVGATGSVDVGEAIAVNTEPTIQFLNIYPSPEYEAQIDILIDLDIPFRRQKTRAARGSVRERKKATFSTAFTEDLTDDAEIY